MNKVQTIKNGFLKLPDWPRKKGAVLLFVVLFISAMLSISSGIFSVAMGQLLISGRAEDSFIALYSTDHGLERTLYRDFVSGPFTCSPTCTEDSKVVYPSGITSGGCYTMSTTKGGSPDITRIKIVGQYRCVIIPGRVVKRAFEYTYLTPLPPGPLLPTSPVGEWKFEEGAGPTANDTSGNSNNGTLVNGPAWQAAASCKIGGCLSFDGVDDYVDTVSNVFDPSITNFTASLWFRIDTPTAGATDIIFSQLNGVGTGRTWIQTNTAANPNKFSSNLGGTQTAGATTLISGRWYHAAVTKTGGGIITLYLDGTQDGSGTVAVESATGISRMGASKATPATLHFSGAIDNVRTYDRALTPAEVLQLFNE